MMSRMQTFPGKFDLLRKYKDSEICKMTCLKLVIERNFRDWLRNETK